MTIDLNQLLERIADFRFDLQYRPAWHSDFATTLSKPEDSDGRPIQWLKIFHVELRDILDEMKVNSFYIRDPELYERGKALLKTLDEVTEPFNTNYMVFERIVKELPYKRITESEMPSTILASLVSHLYDLPQAARALASYLDICEGRFGIFPNANNIRDELEILVLMEDTSD